MCDPSIDLSCEEELSEGDRQVIQGALGRYVHDPSALSDPAAREQCAAMGTQFRDMLAQGKVFRGSTTTQPGDPGVDPHFGAYDPLTGHLHFDPAYLDDAAAGDPAALRELANTALHEGAHAFGFDHDDGTPGPFGPGLLYTEDYFKWLSPGASSCIKYS